MGQFIYYPVPSYLNLDGRECIEEAQIAKLIVWNMSVGDHVFQAYTTSYHSFFLPFNFGIVYFIREFFCNFF